MINPLILAYAVLVLVSHVVTPERWRAPIAFFVAALGVAFVAWLLGADAALLAFLVAVNGACFGAHTGPLRRLAGEDEEDGDCP